MNGKRECASLIIGGTGMLAGASRWLVRHSAMTLLVARRASFFAAGTDNIRALDLDWNAATFRASIQDVFETVPPIECALLWLHKPELVLPWLLPMLGTTQVVVVLGSRHGQVGLPSTTSHIATLRLGGMPTASGRRELTHDEISNGAIEVLKDGKSRVLGELA